MTAIQQLIELMIMECDDVNDCINTAIAVLYDERQEMIDAYRAGEYDGITTALKGKRIYIDEFDYYTTKTKKDGKEI